MSTVVVPPGLSADEAADRLGADGPNELPTAISRSFLRQAWAVLREPMLLLLVGAGTLNFVLAEPLDGILLMASVFVVVGISIFQERKTERALVALRDLSSPRALVIRDGVQRRIAGREVVRGDCILISEGDRVPADATLWDAVNLSIDESALTGESLPVRKTAAAPSARADGIGPPGGDGVPWVFSGTLVLTGHGLAVVGGTGWDTVIGRIGEALRTIETERTRLQREVDRLVRMVATVGFATAALVVVVYGLTRGGWLEGALAGIATAMSMVPEEFPVVLTVFLALGAWRMSQRNVLTRRTAVIETLGAATVVCVDKTGTLTRNSMSVRELVVGGSVLRIAEDAPLPEAFHEIAEFGVLASPVGGIDPVDQAFARLGQVRLAGTEHLHETWELVREYPLSEELLALSHVWRSPDDTRFVVAAKGAPEAIAELCHLPAGETAALLDHVARAAAAGNRVLAVARAGFERSATLPTDHHEFDFEMLGLVALADPLRPDAATAVAECRRAGIRTVMITGDYPGTALAIATEVGIDTSGGTLTGPEVGAMSAEELAARVGAVNVFARMVPDQKLRLVRALQANGDVVAMTGDGVNDAPALRAADIGIAMGARGTDVARESADLVITDDDMSSIAGGIRRGRGIFDNLRKAMSYIVAVHVTIVGMAVFPLLDRDWPLVLLPLQIALLELVIDPTCSVVFEMEEIDPRIMDQPPRSTSAPLFGGRILALSALQGVSVLIAVISVYLWAVLGGRADAIVRSLTFSTLVLANLGLILVNRSWRLTVWQTVRERHNPALRWILASTLALLAALLLVRPLGDAFRLGPIGVVEAVVALGAAVAGVSWFEVYKRWSNRSAGGAT